MTPEQQFSRWVRRALVVFALVFTYVVWMDLHAPLTTLSRVQRYVVQVAPQVAGEVTGVAVTNGDHVNQGDLLFTVAEQDYRLIMDGAELRV
ncbi:MAG: biotin/lipoyl-binding protein, partial [Alloalcanivorax xenomutans]